VHNVPADPPSRLTATASPAGLQPKQNGADGVGHRGESSRQVVPASVAPVQHRTKTSQLCVFFMQGSCSKGTACPFVHPEVEEPPPARGLGAKTVRASDPPRGRRPFFQSRRILFSGVTPPNRELSLVFFEFRRFITCAARSNPPVHLRCSSPHSNRPARSSPGASPSSFHPRAIGIDKRYPSFLKWAYR
jgi:hypothetical protein